MTTDMEELKRLAEEAVSEVGIIPGPKRMAFIAAANPATVLALLERVRRLEEAEKVTLGIASDLSRSSNRYAADCGAAILRAFGSTP